MMRSQCVSLAALFLGLALLLGPSCASTLDDCLAKCETKSYRSGNQSTTWFCGTDGLTHNITFVHPPRPAPPIGLEISTKLFIILMIQIIIYKNRDWSDLI